MLNSIQSPLSGLRSPFGGIKNPFAIYNIGGQTPQTIADFEADKYASANKNLGPELVTNGTFDTDLTGWTVGTDPAQVVPTWDAGRVSLARGGGGNSGFSQTFSTSGPAGVYLVEFDLVSSTLGGIAFSLSGSVSVLTGVGKKSVILVRSSTTTSIIFWPSSANATVVLDNISVREVVSYSPASTTASSLLTHTRASTATYVDSTGTLQTAAINELRKDNHIWDGSSWVKRCLVEPQSTNLVLNSDTLSTQNVTVTAALHTLHFTGTGTVTLSGASTAGPLVGTGAGEQNRVSLQFTPTAGTLTLTVTGTVNNAQLETGVQTSYIPTSGSTVTRAADALSIDSTLLPYDSTAMTIAMELNATYADNGTASGAGPVGEIVYWKWNATNQFFMGVSMATTSTATGLPVFMQEENNIFDQSVGSTEYTPGINVPMNIASRHTSSDINGAVSGVANTANTTPTALPDLSATDFDIAPTGVVNIKTIRILGGYGATDAELEAATT